MRLASLARDLLWVATGRLVGAVGLLLVTAMLSRALDPVEYGEFFLIVSLVAISVTIATLGQQQIVIRELGRLAGAQHLRVVVTSMAIVSCSAALVSGLIGLAGSRLAVWIEVTHLETFGWLVALWVFAAAVLRVAGEAARGLRMFSLASFFNGYAVTGSAATLVLFSALLAPAMVSQRLDLPVALRSVVLATGVSLVFVLVALTRYRSAGSGVAVSAPARAYILSGLPILVGNLVSFASSQGDLWIVHALLETERVAVYGAVRTVANLGLVPLAMVSAALLPRIALTHFAGRKVELEQLVRVSASVAVAAASVVMVPAIVAPGPLLSLLFGPYYADGSLALRLLAAGSLVNVCSGPWGYVLLQTGRHRLFLAISSVAAIIGLGLAYALGGSWGLEGIAAAWLVGQGILSVVGIAAVKRSLGIISLPTLSAAQVARTLRASS